MNSVRFGSRNPSAVPLTKNAATIHQADVPALTASIMAEPAASRQLPNTIRRCGSVCLGNRRPLMILPNEIAATSGVSSSPASLGE
ncbi:hypothetical protein FR5810_01279 [Bordetella pertussis]|nr:hypothetical protein FR5810_01279 [Bordetella pertussis]